MLRDLATPCDLLLPGRDEAELLAGESEAEAAARQLAGLGPARVVLKLEARGAPIRWPCPGASPGVHGEGPSVLCQVALGSAPSTAQV